MDLRVGLLSFIPKATWRCNRDKQISAWQTNTLSTGRHCLVQETSSTVIRGH